MRGRTEENIRKSMEKMHKIAEAIYEQELEVLPSYIEDKPPENDHQAVWYLGRSIQLLSEADYFIGTPYNGFAGCDTEFDIARRYKIPALNISLKYVATDVLNERDGECVEYGGGGGGR